MQTNITLEDLLARWATDEGKPYKGSLIDYSAYQDNPDNIGCMCAQGQALHFCCMRNSRVLRWLVQVARQRNAV